MRKLVIDVDCALGIPGADIDDGLEILIALGSRDVSIQGITVVAGNVSAEEAAWSVLSLLDAVQAPTLPVAIGCKAPITGRGLVTGRELLAQRIRAAGRVPPPKTREPEWEKGVPHRQAIAEHASDFIIRTIREYPAEVTLVCTAPLSNVAHALRKDPGLTGLIKEMYVMGGLLTAIGNVTRSTEFNIATDPVAAAEVLGSGVPITLVPLDVTLRTMLDRVTWNQLVQESPLLKGYVNDSTLSWLGFLEAGLGLPGCNLHDPLAFALFLDPSIADYRSAYVQVCLDPGEDFGRTHVDFNVNPDQPSPIKVVTAHDNARFMELMRSSIRQAAGGSQK